MTQAEGPRPTAARSLFGASALLFVSGAAALVFEALWFHQAAIALGSDVVASSTVLAAFMGGMALGGLLAPRLLRRARRPLHAYAALELCVGALGLGAVLVLPALGAALAPLSLSLAGSPASAALLRVGTTLLVLGVPAIAMGATVPVMLAALAPSAAGFGRALGVLYGVNTAGAVAGVLAAELWTIPVLGIRGSAFASAAGCAVLAGCALALARRGGRLALAGGGDGRDGRDGRDERAALAPDLRVLLLASALAGFALLGLEVVWFRFLALVLNDTSLAFATVLATVLLGIAIGGALGGALAARREVTASLAGATAFATGALGLLSYRLYGALVQGSFSFDQGVVTVLKVAAPLVLPASLASGVLYAWTGGVLRRALRAASGSSSAGAEAAGKLAFANTAGAALGALAAGLLLLPNAGIERALVGLCVSYGAAGLLLTLAEPPAPGGSMSVRARYAAPLALVLALATFPFGDVRARFVDASARRWMHGEDRVVRVVDARTATLVHIEHRAVGLHVFDQIATNAYSMTVDDFAARRYMKLFSYLPAALHPKIERALVIGYGLGSTAQAVLDNADVTRLDVVDVEPKLLALASQIIADRGGRDPLADPRARVHIDDGRHFVQLAARGGQGGYDLITGEPPPPIMAGVSHLYTREYFELLREALRDGGMVTYWLPMMNLSAASARAIAHAFCDAFPSCSLWHGSGKNFMLLGIKGLPPDRQPVSLDRYTRMFRTGALRSELIAIGFDNAAQLGPLFIGDAAYLRKHVANMPSLTDDFPRRIAIRGRLEDRDAMILQWRDTAAARKRFEHSELVAQLFPAIPKRNATRMFEHQRLFNDLMLNPNTAARQVAILGQVLEHTPITLSALLMLKSDPDIQAAMRALDRSALEAPALLPHRLAAALAARDYREARRLASALRDDQLPLPGLREYIDVAALRASP